MIKLLNKIKQVFPVIFTAIAATFLAGGLVLGASTITNTFIATDGNLGVGVMNPTAAKLDLNQTIVSFPIINSNSGEAYGLRQLINVGSLISIPSNGGSIYGSYAKLEVPTSNSANLSNVMLTGSKLSTAHYGAGDTFDISGLDLQTRNYSPSGSVERIMGTMMQASHQGGGAVGEVTQLSLAGGGYAGASGYNGTITNAYGIKNSVLAGGVTGSSMTISNAYGINSQVYTLGSGGKIVNGYNVYLKNPTGGSVSNNYGLYIENQTGGSSLNYSIYSAGGNNYLAGMTQLKSGLIIGDYDNTVGAGYAYNNKIVSHMSGQEPRFTSPITVPAGSCVTSPRVDQMSQSKGLLVVCRPIPMSGGVETLPVTWNCFTDSSSISYIRFCNVSASSVTIPAQQSWRMDYFTHEQ